MSTGFPLLDYAAARRSDPQESHDAAARVPVAERERQVMEALRAGPATMHEVAERLGMPLTSISPRFAPLFRKGLVRKCGRRDGRTVWEVVA